ncbi:MAG: ABC transporter ATP-binding protein [Acidiferrobacterales bacterium]
MIRIEAHDLNVRVPGRTLCAGLSVRLRAGENWAILGPNGSGKTTLVHTMAGLRVPDDGRVVLNGSDIGAHSSRARARLLGVLLQHYDAAFPATVAEIVLTGRHPYLSRWQWHDDADDIELANSALAAVGLADFGPRRLSTLSGGERRRVEIATLLTQDPPVCLLDEPTNHLDLHHQIDVLRLLAERRWRPGCLTVFVLHDVNIATRFCTHALLLFGNGQYRYGKLPSILDTETLEQLYGCPIRPIEDAEGTFYFPA